MPILGVGEWNGLGIRERISAQFCQNTEVRASKCLNSKCLSRPRPPRELSIGTTQTALSLNNECVRRTLGSFADKF